MDQDVIERLKQQFAGKLDAAPDRCIEQTLERLVQAGADRLGIRADDGAGRGTSAGGRTSRFSEGERTSLVSARGRTSLVSARGRTSQESARGRTSQESARGRTSQESARGRTSLARMIDHTALKPETSVEDVQRLCEEARTYGFASVCLNPCYVPLAAEWLAGTGVAVCTVVGFPLGANRTTTKAFEAEHAVRDGASEIDMVLNVGMLKSAEYDYVEADVASVVGAVRSMNGLTKVILETALLSTEEKIVACVLAQKAGADYVKTSTGFSGGGATSADVALMREVVGLEMGVKASGGIRSAAAAREMIERGASRIGASASVAIVEGERTKRK